MNLTAIILLSVGLAASAEGHSQTITLDMRNAPIQKVFREVIRQTGTSIVYNEAFFKDASPITIKVRNATITDVLGKCLRGRPFTFNIVNNAIVIKESSFIAAKFQKSTATPPPIEIHGSVKDESGSPLVNASVTIKGTHTGATTNANGDFNIVVPGKETIIIISYTGYESQEIQIGNRSTIEVNLVKANNFLSAVVVTALGIERNTKSLTYATQNISSAELTGVKSASFMNSLAGKVAGVVITKGSAGPGASTNVLLRGNKSIMGNNQPLYVIDGIPMSNNASSSSPNSLFNQQDFGDAISNLNQEDIESIEVLKGASAAALYGSQAANGVILVTTKKGKKGNAKIDFSSTTTFEAPIGLPENQITYGQTAPGSNESWGAKIADAKNDEHVKNFFNTGTDYLNSLSISSGSDLGQVYISYANTKSKGIVPENDLLKHNFYLRGTTKMLHNKLSLDASVNYINQEVHNRPQSGYYLSPIFSLYLFPTGDDFSKYSGSNYQTWDPVRLLYSQNWPYIVNEASSNQNPYWIQNKNQNDLLRERSILSLSGKYSIFDWLNIQGRINYDKIEDSYEQRISATTDPVMSSANGGYTKNVSNINQLYSDVLLSGSKNFNDLSLAATLGYSITQNRNYGTNLGSIVSSGLAYPNFFSVDGLKFPFNASENLRRSLSQAVFGTATIGYRSKMFLDVTGRNEWNSTVAQNFFYPSIGLSYILTDGLDNTGFLSFAKLRGSFAEVGNALPFGISSNAPSYTLSPIDDINPRGTLPFFSGADTIDLKPERTQSYEFGTELRFFEDKLSLNLTYYNATTGNQVFTIAAPAGSGASNFYINGGTIRNKGLEGVLSYRGEIGRVKWTFGVNFSHNKNQVIQLSDALTAKRFVLTDINSTRQVQLFLTRPEGGNYGSYGDLYGKKIQYNKDGTLVVDADGLPVLSKNPDEYIGNANPDYLLGFNNTFSYKKVSLHLLIDGRFGGKIVSITDTWRDWKGLSERTAEARDDGGVMVNGKLVSAEAYYKRISGTGQQGAIDLYSYDATNIRLRELSIGYTLPKFTNAIKDLSISFIGRNLLFFYKKAPFDPEVSIAPSNGLQGIDAFNLPSTHSYGISLRASF